MEKLPDLKVQGLGFLGQIGVFVPDEGVSGSDELRFALLVDDALELRQFGQQEFVGQEEDVSPQSGPGKTLVAVPKLLEKLLVQISEDLKVEDEESADAHEARRGGGGGGNRRGRGSRELRFELSHRSFDALQQLVGDDGIFVERRLQRLVLEGLLHAVLEDEAVQEAAFQHHQHFLEMLQVLVGGVELLRVHRNAFDHTFEKSPMIAEGHLG